MPHETPIHVPPLTVRQWTKVEARFRDAAGRFRAIGKPDRAETMAYLAEHIGKNKSATRLVLIPFSDADAATVLEMLAITGIGAPEPTNGLTETEAEAMAGSVGPNDDGITDAGDGSKYAGEPVPVERK